MKRPSFEFWKMSGAGNDFILLKGVPPSGLPDLDAASISELCRRGTGIGADGLIVLDPSTRAGVRMRHWNSDGLENDYCGNGTRCAARLAFELGMTGRTLTLETGAGLLRAEVLPDGTARVQAPPAGGAPVRVQVPLADAPQAPREGYLVTCGVPHLVVEVPDPARVDVASLGARFRAHPALGPGGANVDFVCARPDGTIDIRTFERGIEGETLACGSGALAAAAWAWQRHGNTRPVVLITRSGLPLTVTREAVTRDGAGPYARTWLEGEARIVFTGRVPAET